ncbi:MAG: MATE family efflux transporter [Acidovorax sp.]|uniref:MATE family efflux transporter n=1 Tax=Acidovorax sp. TaxID=1872122 RepID=UPI0039E6B039
MPEPALRQSSSELSIISRHALTVLAGQLAVMAFGVADTIVAGRHGEASLAALSVGSAIFISVYVALMGMLQALLPVWAEQRGAGQPQAIGRSVRQALYLCGAASVLGVAVLLSPGPLLRWTEVPPELRTEVEAYLAVLALALPPALFFRIYSTLNQALGRPQLVTWLQVGALFIKLPLSVWFTFGGAGLPAQGVVGCAWATLVVNVSMLALAFWLLRTQSLYIPLRLWRRMEAPHWPTIAGFARLGVPAGLAVMVEVTSFTLMALFVARQGATASAAHQIASTMAAVLYMVPLSLAIATSARASYWLGAGDTARARAVVYMGFRAAALMGIALAAILFIAKEPIARVYTTQAGVAAMAGSVLAWVAAYHLADALQTLCVFVLRCYRITIAPLLVYCTLLWGAGLGGGYVLAYRGIGPWPAIPAPTTFWAASAAALSVTALLFTALLWRAVNAAGSPER